MLPCVALRMLINEFALNCANLDRLSLGPAFHKYRRRPCKYLAILAYDSLKNVQLSGFCGRINRWKYDRATEEFIGWKSGIAASWGKWAEHFVGPQGDLTAFDFRALEVSVAFERKKTNDRSSSKVELQRICIFTLELRGTVMNKTCITRPVSRYTGNESATQLI